MNDENIIQSKLMDATLIIKCLILIKALSNTNDIKYEQLN